MNWDYREIVNWLKEFHPDIYDAWYLHTKPKRDLEAKRLKEKFDAVQKWLDEMKDHPRWKNQDDFRKAIQMSLDMYNTTDDEEKRADMWNAIRALAGSHPTFPTRKGIRSEEE